MNLLMSLMSCPKSHAPVQAASLAWSFAIKKDYELKDSPEKKNRTHKHDVGGNTQTWSI